MLKIRQMGKGDIGFAIKVAGNEGWAYSNTDLRRVMAYEPRGCFVAMDGRSRVGIATAVNYGPLGWIGNVVVAERHRGMGAGKALVVHAAGYLKSQGVRTVKLNSYNDKREFYLGLGFEEEDQCAVLSGKKGLAGEGKVKRPRRATAPDLRRALALDRRTFGFNRERLLTRSFRDFPHMLHCTPNGYIMGNDSLDVCEAGPWVCSPRAGEDEPRELVSRSMASSRLEKMALVVPERNEHAVELLTDMGFTWDFSVAVMRFGEPLDCAEPGGVLGLFSLAQG